MRKIELIDLVLDNLAGGDAPDDVRGRYHREIISNLLDTAFSKLVNQTFFDAKNYSDYSVLDSWAKNYSLVITNEAVRLPYPPIQLPGNLGIRQVTPDGDLTNAFAYRDTNANAVFAALEVGSVSTKPTFYIEMETATMSGQQTPQVLKLGQIPDGCTQVNVKMIVPFKELDDYDKVALPAGAEETLLAFAIEGLRTKAPEDTINDSKANQQ